MARSTPLSRPREPKEGAAYGLAYYRVSTSRQANTSFDEDGFSIQAQREYCQRKAAELGVQLVDEYTDRGKSARTADRPALQAMLARIKEDTAIQYVFVHKLDRLARSRADDVQIGLLLAKQGVRLVSCTESIDDSPSGRLVHGIMADIAEWYSANLSEESRKGMRKKVESGGTPGFVPIGYQNVRHKIVALGKDIGAVRVHQQYGPIVTECFRRYDSGHSTLADLVAYATDQGLRMRANKCLPERPMSRSNMQRLLRNRYYAGWITYGGVAYKGDHPPLIDEPTFERVQALLTARDSNKDKSRKRPHPLKGVLCCARCGRRLGITLAHGRGRAGTYPYFFCLGRQVDKTGCPQSYIPLGDIEDAVRAYWGRLHIPAARIHALREAVLANFARRHDQGQAEIARHKRRLVQFEQRRQKAKAAYYANALSLDEFKVEQETIQRSVQTAETVIAQWGVDLESIRQALDTACALLENPPVLYDALPAGLKPVFVQTVVEKIWVLDNTVVGAELTAPFAELLTFEAQLELAEQQRTAARGTAAADSGGTDDGQTYYRRRRPLPVPAGVTGHQAVRTEWRDWLPVERPQGPLPIDTQNPGTVHGGQGSKNVHLVGEMRLNLNSQLARYLRKHPLEAVWRQAQAARRKPARRWRLRDRLSERDIVRLILAFQVGAPKQVLAEHYGIGMNSVKKILRQHGVKKRSRYDEHPAS